MTARAELAESLLGLLDVTDTATFVLAEDWTFRYLNACAAGLLDLDASVVGSDARILAGGVLPEGLLTAVGRVLAGAPTEVFAADAGDDAGVHARVLPLADGVMVVLRDRADRRTADELRRQRDLYQQILDHAPCALSIRDLNSRFRLVNEAGAELLGRSAGDLVGLTLHEVFPDHVAEKVREADLQVQARAQVQEHGPLAIYQREQGRDFLAQLFPVCESDGTVSGTGTVVTDVTDIKALQSELAAVHERYQQVFSSTSLGILLIQADHNVLEANTAACRMLGYSRAQLLTMQGPDLIRGTEEQLAAQRSQVLEDGVAGYEIESELVRSDGQPLRALLTVNTFPDPTGPGQLVSVLIRDLTGVDELRDRAVRAERMEATGRLAAGVAHDANNILAAVSGYTEMLAEVVAASPDGQRYVDGITRSINRAGEMVSQLLAFTRGLHLDADSVDLADIAVDLEDMLRRLLPSEVSLVVRAEAAPTLADSSQVRQVALNLVVNAGQASHAGGTVTLATGLQQIGDDDLLLPAGAYACLTVTDDGDGMDEQVASRCFEPFFSTRVAQGGTGLGLSTALGIARQSGGDLRVDGRPGTGAEFRLLLPLHGPDLPDPAPTGDASSSSAHGTDTPPSGGALILLADDDDAIRMLVAEALRRGGHAVLEASDGRAALDKGVIPDLLITDVEMPHLGGPQLARALREVRPELPVLFITGQRSASPDESSPVLHKPFSLQVLLQTVASLVGGPS